MRYHVLFKAITMSKFESHDCVSGFQSAVPEEEDRGGFQQVLHFCLGLCRLHPISTRGKLTLASVCIFVIRLIWIPCKSALIEMFI